MRVLGSELEAVTDAMLLERLVAASHRRQPFAVEFANTHVLGERTINRRFAEASKAFDMTVPDAAPLVWVMKRRGAWGATRVYGPHFMEVALREGTGRHYLLGGNADAPAAIQQRLGFNNAFAGSWHGRIGPQGECPDLDTLASAIGSSGADFVWVGLGTPKQQYVIAALKQRLARGVLLSIGQAFDVLAGTRADAPDWMFNNGLTWLYRLLREPRRLGWRYTKYNSLFLWLLAREELARATHAAGRARA